jgi:hypothetical protein
MLQSKLNDYGEVVNSWVEPAKAEPIEKLSKNQKRKLRDGHYTKEHQEKMLSLLIHGKYYQPKANRKGGLVRGQLSMRKSILMFPDVLIDRIRQLKKEGLFTLKNSQNERYRIIVIKKSY